MLTPLETARQINTLLLEVTRHLDDSVRLVQASCSDEEFKTYRRAVGKILGEVLLEVLNPLYSTHPSFKPKGFE